MTDATTPATAPREWRLASRPTGWPTPENFELAASQGPELADGQSRVGNEVLFSHTQQYAHVLSGDMKSTGNLEVELGESGLTIDADLSYGGPAASGEDVDYTIYELRRGGSHDFFARALKQSTKILEEGGGHAMIEVMRDAFE